MPRLRLARRSLGLSLSLSLGLSALPAGADEGADDRADDRASARGGQTARLIATLTAADQARAAQAQEANDWALERDRLEAVISATQAEAARLRSAATHELALVDAASEAVEAAQADAAAEASRRWALEAAALIHRRLTALDPQITLPAIDEADPEGSLTAALAQLREVEATARRVEVGVETGLLSGERRAVQILRLGHVATWWRALDGADAGTAQWQDGALQLTPLSGPDAEEIGLAFEIVEGARPPSLLTLPAQHLPFPSPTPQQEAP